MDEPAGSGKSVLVAWDVSGWDWELSSKVFLDSMLPLPALRLCATRTTCWHSIITAAARIQSLATPGRPRLTLQVPEKGVAIPAGRFAFWGDFGATRAATEGVLWGYNHLQAGCA